MARLKHTENGAEIFLATRHLVGRAPRCHLRLSHPLVSGVHAEIRWDGIRWLVQDMGSKNGTFIDGRRMGAGESAALPSGSRLAFGTEQEGFEIIDLTPPRLMAIASDGTIVVAEANLLCLPSEEQPVVTVFEADGRWLIESDEGTQGLSEQHTVSIHGVLWTIEPPNALESTCDGTGSSWRGDDVSLEFFLSRDEEHVDVKVIHGRMQFELKSHAHLHLLLALARIRLTDAQDPQLSASEHGWIHREDLAKALNIDVSLLNLWVYRARRQLVTAGVRDAGRIIERRVDALQLRIGFRHLVIHHA